MLSSIKRGLSSVEGPVSRFIDAGIMQQQLDLFGAYTTAYGLRSFFQHALDWLKTGHDTAGRPSVFGHVTTWLIAPEQHLPPHYV